MIAEREITKNIQTFQSFLIAKMPEKEHEEKFINQAFLTLNKS